VYDQVGSDFYSSNVAFEADLPGESGQADFEVIMDNNTGGALQGLLRPGDEFLVRGQNSSARAVLQSINGNLSFECLRQGVCPEGLYGDSKLALSMIRPARRNLLSGSVGSIRSLKNPLEDREPLVCHEGEWEPAPVIPGEDYLHPLCIESVKKYLDLACKLGVDEADNSILMKDILYDSPDYFEPCQVECTTLALTRTDGGLRFSYTENQNDVVVEHELCQLWLGESAGNPIQFNNVEAIGKVTFIEDVPPGFPLGATDLLMVAEVFMIGEYYPREYIVYSDCGELQDREILTGPTRYGDPSGEDEYTSFDRIDGVIEATATEYSDVWPRDWADVRFYGSEDEVSEIEDRLNTASGYETGATGAMGAWRPHRFHSYVEDRRYSDPIDPRRDGTFELIMFDFGGIAPEGCITKWILDREVSRYGSFGLETENRDGMGVASAALYGFENSLVTAVVNNAELSEIGFDGLEQYRVGQSVKSFQLANTNIDFETRKRLVKDVVRVCYRIGVIIDDWTVTLDRRPDIPLGAELDIYVEPTGGRPVPPPPPPPPSRRRVFSDRIDPRVVPEGPQWDRELIGTGKVADLILPERDVPRIRFDRPLFREPRIRTGKIEVCYSKVIYRWVTESEVSQKRAHTGRNSLKVNHSATFVQHRLTPISGKEYTLTAWVARDTVTSHTFRVPEVISEDTRLGIRPVFYHGEEVLELPDSLAEPSGPIIDGWQRLQSSFVIPAEYDSMAFRYQVRGSRSGKSVPAYFDDIRFRPSSATVACYVYDPLTFRLAATLNETNHAAFYHYDEQGELRLVENETVDGVKTVSETRQHIVERGAW
jgi:hypothetical protein